MTVSAPQAKLPPGPRYPLPLSTLGWITRPLPFMERCRARYGDVFSLRVAHENTWVFLAHPEAVKQVFTGDPALLHAGEANFVLKPVLGSSSVLVLDDAAHVAQRRLMLPSFHGERLQRYGDLMASIADREIERWPIGEPFALWPRMQAITLEVIMRTVFGVREGDRLHQLRSLLKRMLEWTADPKLLFLFAALGPKRAQKSGFFRRAMDPVDAMVFEEIRRRRHDPALAERDDVLSLLLQARHEDGRPMSDAELRDELMTLLVAGHETTATALAWAIERLVRHPDKLERLRQESLAGEEEYLEAVAKETLRLRPVLPIVLRRLTQPMEIGGYALPAGVSVAPCIYLIHRRPDIYPEPQLFRPERFMEQPTGTYTWIPFGGGVRRCLGASFALFEMKTVLGAIAARTRLRPSNGAAEGVTRRAIVLSPRRRAEVILESRDGAAQARDRRAAEREPEGAAAS